MILESWYKKGLVLGVVVLFIGVGVQPAFAVETKSSFEEDCDCQKIDEFNLVRFNLLLTKLEIVTNILFSRFGHIPEIEEICKSIFHNINSFNPLSDNPIICAIIEHIYLLILSAYDYVESVIEELEASGLLGDLIAAFLMFPLLFIVITGFLIEMLGYGWDCWDDPPMTSYRIKQIFSRI